jgi:hypothetical protein
MRHPRGSLRLAAALLALGLAAVPCAANGATDAERSVTPQGTCTYASDKLSKANMVYEIMGIDCAPGLYGAAKIGYYLNDTDPRIRWAVGPKVPSSSSGVWRPQGTLYGGKDFGIYNCPN